jgi:DNA-binding LytR/AlgR family response regulator
MFTYAIVDDDIFSIKILQQLLTDQTELICIKSFASPLNALDYLQKNTVDILFLDIQMPEINGLDFRDKLQTEVEIIFTTSSTSYALKAFDGNVTDYLVKPFTKERLQKALQKAMKKIVRRKNEHLLSQLNTSENTLSVKHRNKNFKINYSDIFYIESKREYLNYHTKAGEIVDYGSLTNLINSLPEEHFIRIHKSYVVNIKQIKNYNKKQVTLSNDEILPVGRIWQQSLLDFLSSELGHPLFQG